MITHINSYFTGNKVHSELIKKLDSLGLKQSVFVPIQKKSYTEKNQPDGLINSKIIYDHCFRIVDRYLWPLKMLKIWSSFKRIYQPNSTNLIHAHTLIVNGLIAYWVKRKYGTNYVVTVRNTDINVFLRNSPFFRLIGLKILENASVITTISPAYRDIHLTKYFKQKDFLSFKSKSLVIPNGINDFWIHNRQKKQNQQKIRTVIFVGRIDKNKNLGALVSACELLQNKSFKLKLLVAGDGPLLNDFRKRKIDLEIQFLGHISSRENLLELYRQADLLANPSLAETFGLVYPEAMSQGLPVIYTKNEGFDGFYPDGHVGFAVDPKDSADIADKIQMIYKEYERISANAFEAAKDFSWDKVAERLIKIYSSVH